MDMKGLAERANASWDEILEFLDSPSGRRVRHLLATGVIVSVPLVMRLPGLRRSPVGRLIELAGGATIVVKLAEWIRDWERERATQVA